MMRNFYKIFDAIAARFSMVILGLLVAIFGLVSPTRVLYALRESVFKGTICKDC